MVERILNWLKEQKKYSIILIALLVMTMWLLWKAKWMLFLLWKIKLNLLSVFQTELLLIVLILITSITASNISKIRKKLSLQSTKTKPVKTYNRNLSEGLEQKYAIHLASETSKMLMNISWATAIVCSSVLLMKLFLFLLKM